MGLYRAAFSLFVILNSASCDVQQTWSEQPANQEVNPGGDVLLGCVINDMRGQCRWEKDGTPVGIFPGKYHDCQMAIAKIFRLYVFGPSGFWTMAPLHYAAKFDPFLSLDCARVEGVGAQSKERKG